MSLSFLAGRTVAVTWKKQQCGCESLEDSILAHRLLISEILPWDRKSYLTQAVT